jgi:hypothetical protein
MHNAIVVSWGSPVRGREISAAKVFSEWVEMLGAWQSKGSIKSFTPCFLNANGGPLGGFFLVQGDVAKLGELYGSEEIRKATTRAQLIVENFGVVKALTGDEIGKQMAVFSQNAAEFGAK